MAKLGNMSIRLNIGTFRKSQFPVSKVGVVRTLYFTICIHQLSQAPPSTRKTLQEEEGFFSKKIFDVPLK